MIDINELRRLALDGDLYAVQEVIARLEAAEKERDTLRAKIEAMEKQESTVAEPCPLCGDALVVHSRCVNKACEAWTVTAENARYNKAQTKYNRVRAFMKTCATRLNEQPELTVPEPLTVSQVAHSEYANGWNDCIRAMLASEPGGKP